jgi:hypothetical protein
MARKSSDVNEDMSPMRASLVALHEVYSELKAVGFSRKDALHIISAMIIYGMVEGSGEED